MNHTFISTAGLIALATGLLATPTVVAQEKAKDKEADKTAAEDFETRSFVLKYAKASEVADSLNQLCRQLGVREAAVAFADSHTVAVASSPKVVEACAKIVAEVDTKPKQVYVEARFLDVLMADIEKLGINWTMLDNFAVNGGVSAGVGGAKLPNGATHQLHNESGVSFGNVGGSSNGSFYQGKLSASDLALLLSALRTNNDNRMFANPRVIVASGKTATVDITTKRPNVIITAKRVVGDSNTLDVDAKLQAIPGKDKLMFADEAFFWWGIGLRVEPYVAEDGVITARIIPNVSSLSDITSQGEGAYVTSSTTADGEELPASKFPIIDVKRIETEFSLKSGETAVIGGLSKTEFQELETGIPYLWKIPWIGPRLFGYTQKVKRQREIVVLVTMGLVDPEKPVKSAGLPKNAFITREYVNGNRKEPGDYTYDELKRMYRQDEKPNRDEDEK